MKMNALDLSTQEPRDILETLAGYVIAARTLDKCRATIAETAGDYLYGCPLDQIFLKFTNISADRFKQFVATGADDTAVAEWINQNAKYNSDRDIAQWNETKHY